MGETVTWLTQSSQWSGPDGIPARLLEHIWYSVLGVGIAALIALPVGLLIGHTGRGSLFAATLSNFWRALPTLGVVTLVFRLQPLSVWPVIVALVAIAIPPILLNTDVGIRSIDPTIRDAARGMGMTGRQALWRVEVPLAMPLILAGFRSAAGQVVATATIAAFVGLGGLGPLHHRRLLQPRHRPDHRRRRGRRRARARRRGRLRAPAALPGPEGGAASQARRRARRSTGGGTRMKKGIWLLLAACLALVVAACGGDDALKSNDSSSSGGDKGKPSITVGSANFPENVVLGEIYAGALTAKKFNVSKKLNIGARAAHLLGAGARRPHGAAGVHRLAAGLREQGQGHRQGHGRAGDQAEVQPAARR